MELVIDHLTRMRPGFFCVAGYSRERGAHVRPVPSSGQIPVTLLKPSPSPFEIGTVADLGAWDPAPRLPHVEDVTVRLDRAKRVGRLASADFWTLLDSICADSLSSVFGLALSDLGRWRHATPSGEGLASLGVIRPGSFRELYVHRNQVRMKFENDGRRVDASVTDIRLYRGRDFTPDRDSARRVWRAIGKGVPVLLSVGLTREFASRPESPPFHWLQVNNVHLGTDPTCVRF